MNNTIKFEDLVEMYDKLKVNSSDPYGFLCSENAKKSLTEHCEEISNHEIRELMAIYGLKIHVIPYWPDDLVWVLNIVDFGDVLKNGAASLIGRLSGINVFQLRTANNVPRLYQ